MVFVTKLARVWGKIEGRDDSSNLAGKDGHPGKQYEVYILFYSEDEDILLFLLQERDVQKK